MTIATNKNTDVTQQRHQPNRLGQASKGCAVYRAAMPTPWVTITLFRSLTQA